MRRRHFGQHGLMGGGRIMVPQRAQQARMDVRLGLARAAQHHEAGQSVVQMSQGLC